jgi:homoserine O-acetyltransferase
MPVSHDMFFPVADCRAEQELIPNSERRVIESVSGHAGIFCLKPEFCAQVDGHLRELLEEG